MFKLKKHSGYATFVVYSCRRRSPMTSDFDLIVDATRVRAVDTAATTDERSEESEATQ